MQRCEFGERIANRIGQTSSSLSFINIIDTMGAQELKML